VGPLAKLAPLAQTSSYATASPPCYATENTAVKTMVKMNRISSNNAELFSTCEKIANNLEGHLTFYSYAHSVVKF